MIDWDNSKMCCTLSIYNLGFGKGTQSNESKNWHFLSLDQSAKPKTDFELELIHFKNFNNIIIIITS